MTMDSKTPNGFRVLEPGDTDLATFQLAGKTITCRRSARTLMRRLAEFLHAVEPITEPGWDGVYAYRPVRDGVAPSEHAAGTALDWNASQHPRGGGRYEGWTDTQVRMIRWYLGHTAAGRCFRWGADFSTTVDSMHFEVRSPEVLAEYNRATR